MTLLENCNSFALLCHSLPIDYFAYIYVTTKLLCEFSFDPIQVAIKYYEVFHIYQMKNSVDGNSFKNGHF